MLRVFENLFRNLTKCHNPVTRKGQIRIIQLYQRCHLLIIYFNESYQMFVIPTFKLMSCGTIISSLYTILISADSQNLPKLFYCLVMFLMLDSAACIFATLDLASRVLLLSNSILYAVKNWRLSRTSVVKKFITSMQPIRVYAGPFNVVDRQRGPALLRFCLHRTLLLVVQTRTKI